MEIRFLSDDEIDGIVPFLELLNPDTPTSELQERLAGMKQSNYHCIGVFEDEELVAISGVWLLHKHYIGKHIEADNVIVHPTQRGKGYGKALIDWMHAWAQNKGNVAIELNAYVWDESAKLFWEKHGYKQVGAHYRKVLSE